MTQVDDCGLLDRKGGVGLKFLAIKDLGHCHTRAKKKTK